MLLKNKLLSLTKKGMEKRVQFRNECETKLLREGGKQQIKIKQGFANASEFHLKITLIETVLRAEGGEVIDQFSYKASDRIFKDENKLYFPRDGITPLKLDNEIEYRISGVEKLAEIDPDYKKHGFRIKMLQVIDFSSTRITTITKTVDGTVLIQPKDWIGGGQ